MLCDKIASWATYSRFLPTIFTNAIKWVTSNINDLPEPGKYSLKEGAFVLIQEYLPRPLEGAKFENHRKFVDVHVMVRGRERIFWTKPKSFQQAAPYSEENDFEAFECNATHEESSSLLLEPQHFAIFWPTDWHMPSIDPNVGTETPQSLEKVQKIVLKIPLND